MLAATYYVSPSGNDANPGTRAAPWRSILRVNDVNLAPGDKVLFEGGQRFGLAATRQVNLAANGGFESSLASWTKTRVRAWDGSVPSSAANATVTTDPAVVRSGKRALKIAGSTAGARAQDITARLRPGRSYTFAASARSNTSDPAKGRGFGGVTFYQGGVEIGGASLGFRNTAYSQKSVDFVVPQAFDYAELWFSVEPGSSVLYVDDVSVKETPRPLTLLAHDSGTPTAPVTIGSYGTGRATIDAGNYSAISGTDVQGVIVQDLNVVGTWRGTEGRGGNVGSGITFSSGLPNDGKLKYIRVRRVNVGGFQWSGVRFHGRVGKAGFDDVHVTDSHVHDNGDMGVYFVRTGDVENPNYAYRNVVVRDTRAFNNGGIPDKGGATGLGIHVGDVDGALVERNVAYNNGIHNRYEKGGPVGIMAIDSDRVTFQFNESFANKSHSGKDGSGLDFDAGVTNSVMQYNYTHDNDGPGLHVSDADFARGEWRNNVIRYNVSQNDARHGDYGAIHLYGGSRGAIRDLEIHHNTVFLSPSTRATNSNALISAVRLRGSGANVRIRNNVFQTTGGILLARADSSTDRALFQNNAYWSTGRAFKVRWGSTVYSSLSSWRSAKGQEKNGSAAVGFVVDPKLTTPGGGGTIRHPSKLTTLDAYKLRSDSPLRGKAIRFAPVTTHAPAQRDYFGTTLPTSGNLDLGADEIA